MPILAQPQRLRHAPCDMWYWRALVGAFRANPAHHVALVDEPDRAVNEMEALAD
jgi:hypothetical protein